MRALVLALACWLLPMLAAAQDIAMMPVTIEGRTVGLATKIYKPNGDGPFPTLIFHHGSTGSGRNSAIFNRFFDPAPLA